MRVASPIIDPPSERDFPTVFRKRIAAYGDKVLLRTDGRNYSYRELDLLSLRLANGLVDLGIGEGETVLAMLPNVPEFVLLWMALARINAIEVPVNVHYRENILAHIIGDSGASTMVIATSFLDRLGSIADRIGDLRRLIVLDDMAGPPTALPRGRFEVIRFDACFSRSDKAPARDPAYRDLMAVMYTSGTTGPSKGVMITHAHAYEYAASPVEALHLGPDDIYYAALPLFHIAGQWAVIYSTIIAGGTAALSRSFSLSSFWSDVRRHGATATFLLGAQCNWIFAQSPRPDDGASTLRKVLSSPLFPALDEFKRRFRVEVGTAYGATEINVPLVGEIGNIANARMCGRPRGDKFQIRIVDDADEEVPVGTVGELVVRPKEPWTAMAGYWRHPEWTVEAWRNLWLHSGDYVYRDDEGNYYFSDRKKDAIRRRGENISSLEVEREINAHPAVLESAVIPVASADTEQEVMAVIVLKPDTKLDFVELTRFLEARMAYFMVPRYVEIASELPRTPTGKITKAELRKRGITEATWDRVRAGIVLKR
ncbi:MAG TPA: AMP-binding protein [Stellaceae bacterium]|nr:AMP-binding protein [Stellaceae bacterium]